MRSTDRHTYGRLTVDFPSSFAYPVQVELQLADEFWLRDYRLVMTTGRIGSARLTDDEMDWLLGFDDDVALHDCGADAALDRE
jgi:hypothetical protein